MRPSLCAEAMSSEGGDARSGHVPKFLLGIPGPFPAGWCRTRGEAPASLSKQAGAAPTPHTGERQADNALEREPDNRPPGPPEKGV